MKTLKQHGFSHLAILLIVVVFGVIGFAGWRVYQSNQDSESTQQAAAPAAEEPAEEEGGCEAPEGYTIYSNDEIGFCFAYPTGWGEVALHDGVIDPDHEPAGAYRGSFSDNENASFGVIKTDWEYSGPGRGGPNNATGFTEYKKFVSDSSTPDKIVVNTDQKQLVAVNTFFNFDGVIVIAKRVFSETPNYAGIELNLNVPATAGFDAMSDEPDTLVTDVQMEQMQTVLDSVVEL